MNKIRIIAFREFQTRIRKKSFLIMTVLGPVLFAGVMIIPLWLKTSAGSGKKTIYVSDEAGLFSGKFETTNEFDFSYHNEEINLSKANFIISNDKALLHIPTDALKDPSSISVYSKQRVSAKDRYYLEKTINGLLLEIRMDQLLSQKKIPDIPNLRKISLSNQSIFKEFEREDNSTVLGALGLFLAIMIYLFILLYGVQVMRGVMEEKSNRIVEVIFSSVRPFQLMTGKILGVGMVSMLQFTVWICFSLIVSGLIKGRYGSSLKLFSNENIEQTLKHTTDVSQSLEMNEFVSSFNGIETGPLIIIFLYFFICGYLLYSSIFAAIGAAVDSETDVQQFMLPVTIPLFFSFVVISSVMENPGSMLAITLSIFPLTSPIIMMARLPFGVPGIELASSMIILFVSFLTGSWMAAKIYKTGILMYGKKAGYKELLKWLFYK